MGRVKAFAAAVLMVMLVGGSAVKGQTINTPCTTSMISSFTPCAILKTGSTNNGAIPSTTCCESLRSLANASENACLLLSANVPFQNPFISTLAVSLAQACVLPAQCKDCSLWLSFTGLSWSQRCSDGSCVGKDLRVTTPKQVRGMPDL